MWVEIRYWKYKWCCIWGLGFVCISDSRHSGQYISNMISLRPAYSSLFLNSSQRTLFILGIKPNVEPRAERSVGRYWKVGWQGHLHCGGTRLLEMRRAKCRTSQSYRDSAGWCRRDVCTCLWSIQIHGGGEKRRQQAHSCPQLDKKFPLLTQPNVSKPVSGRHISHVTQPHNQLTPAILPSNPARPVTAETTFVFLYSYFSVLRPINAQLFHKIITLLHVSTLSCHPQGACNQCCSWYSFSLGAESTPGPW